MGTRTWNRERAEKRINAKIDELPLRNIEIKQYVRDTDLTNLAGNVAYRVDGVHLYADILNLRDMLHVTDVEGETCHKRTPPFATLDIEGLSAKNSRRQDAATIYADLDGFTAYVGSNIATDTSSKHVVRALHVLRAELDAVLHEDFQGRKVRFIGDCVHGLMVEGTAQTTDTEETISNMTLCTAALRSSFNLAIDRLAFNGTDATNLGLAVGFEYGPMTVTRLGMKGDLIRCSVSRGVLAAEREQGRCNGKESAIGLTAYNKSSPAVRAMFGDARKRSNLDYDSAVNEMSAKNDKAARAAKAMGVSSLLKPATAAAAPFSFPNRPAGPAKPDGFA